MMVESLRIAGHPGMLAGQLQAELGPLRPLPVRLLVNADPLPDAAAIVRRCTDFAAMMAEETESVIVTILTAPKPGLTHFADHATVAALWAFTRQAALAWAPRRIRVNAIGLGVSPAGPFEPLDRPAIPAAPASVADIVRSIRAIIAWPSMTGQIIRLGA